MAAAYYNYGADDDADDNSSYPGNYGNGSGGGYGGDGGYGGYGGYGDPELIAQTEHILWLIRIINLIFYPPILAFGLVGNSLVFAIMLRKARTSSTYTYLLALSVADSVYLLFSITTWLVFGASNGRLDLRKIWSCNFTFLMTNFPKEVSAWLLVAVSLERALVVYLPTKAKSITNVMRARVVVAVMTAVIFLLNWDFWIALRTNTEPQEGFVDTACYGMNNATDYFAKNISSWVHSTLYSYLPSILLFALNIVIIVKFSLAARANAVQVEAADDKKAGGKAGGAAAAGRTMAKYSRRMTVMGLTLSTTFLVLTLPASSTNIFFTVNQAVIIKDTLRYYNLFLTLQVLSILQHLNHALNFILYCLSSAKFRLDLLILLKCKGRAQIEGSVMDNSVE